MTWAWLLRRVFDIDVEQCAGGGKLRRSAVIEQPEVIAKILKHMRLDPRAAAAGTRAADGTGSGGIIRGIGRQMPGPM